MKNYKIVCDKCGLTIATLHGDYSQEKLEGIKSMMTCECYEEGAEVILSVITEA